MAFLLKECGTELLETAQGQKRVLYHYSDQKVTGTDEGNIASPDKIVND